MRNTSWISTIKRAAYLRRVVIGCLTIAVSLTIFSWVLDPGYVSAGTLQTICESDVTEEVRSLARLDSSVTVERVCQETSLPLQKLPTPATITTTITQLVTSPTLPGKLFASLNVSPTLIFSKASGTCWQTIGSPSSTITESWPILLAQRADGSPRFLVSTNSEGIYRSGDYGQSWFFEKLSFDPKYFLPSPLPAARITSSVDPMRLYLAIHGGYPDIDFGIVPYAWLFVSSDSGLTWQQITMPGRGSPFTMIVRLAPSPLLAGRVYMRVRSFTFNPSYPNAWYRSDDAGQTWTREDRFGGTDELVLDPVDANRLFIYQPIGAGYRVVNNQFTKWQEAPSCTTLYQFFADPKQANVIYLQCQNGLIRSQDGGDHWTTISAVSGGVITVDYSSSGEIFWATAAGNLLVSRDSGTTWGTVMDSFAQLVACQDVFLPAIIR